MALLYALERAPSLAGVIVTGPALHTALRDQKAKVAAARWMGRFVPGLTMPSGLDETLLNRDPTVTAAYRAVPLVHRRASLGFAMDAIAAMDEVLASAARFPPPLLIVHAGDDRINFIGGSRDFAARYAGDRTLAVYDGLFHSVEHEPEHGVVMDDVVQWTNERLNSVSPAVAASTD